MFYTLNKTHLTINWLRPPLSAHCYGHNTFLISGNSN